MAQDNPLSVVTPQSLHYMRDYPPPSNVFKPESGSVNMSALHPPLPPPPPPPQAVMSPVRPNQWIRPQWLPPPGPMGQMPPVGPLRPIRPRRRAEPILFPRVGPHMWRGNRFMRGGRDNYNPGRKPRARFRNPHRKADDESTNSGSPDKSKANGLSKDSPNKNVSIKVERVDDAKKTIAEKCVRKAVRKRKPISEFYPSKPWNRQDAEKALKVELEAYKKQVKTLIIKFPDPDLSWDIIRSYHKAIEKVHFQVPSGPRYCFIQLSDDSNVDQVIADLKEVDFHNLGKIKVEKKFEKPEGNVEPESIDPYTLYIGNLPLTINASLIKEKFPTAARIDVGYAQKMKYTRYAFIRYQTVEESIEAFKASHNIMFDSRNLIVRFRRQKGKNSMDIDLGTKLERREKRKLMECKRHMEDLKKMAEKKIKREQVQSDQNHEPRLEDLLRIGESSEEDEEDDEESVEEKEVDDEENDDDDEIDNEPWKIEGIHEDEDEDDDDEEEEDEDEDDDEDEDENDDDVEEEEEDDEEDDK